MKFNTTQILEKVVSLNASDLHLSVGSVPIIRINTQLKALNEYPALTVDDVDYFLTQILDQEQKDILDVNKELDFSISLGVKARFRINAFYQRGYPSVSLRVVPIKIPTLEELNLPSIVSEFCKLKQGMILVVGPTGNGKTTTIAAMLDKINQTRSEHVVTIEDPIEFVFTNKLSLIEQREMYIDTHSWDMALKSVLRQDPNIVVIGEMRDAETIMAALQISETGHLVFATLHTNSASQTIERIISSFPDSKQNQVRMQFSSVIEVVLSERLLPSHTKGVMPALEIMVANEAVRNMIREGKSHMLDNIISTNASLGMTTLERSLAELVLNNQVDVNDAFKMTMRQEELRRLLKGKS